MFCPRCGQERISDATSFCSRCGYLLTGTAELLEIGGAPLSPATGSVSPRRRGVKQGIFMFLLMFVIAPIVGLISEFGFGVDPWPVGIVIFLLGVGGLLRIAYALMFESKYPQALATGTSGPATMSQLPEVETKALHPSSFVPPGAHRTTRGLEPETREPFSVTDNTTKLLEKDPDV